PRPGLDRVARALLVLGGHLLLEVVVDEGTLFGATPHGSLALLSPQAWCGPGLRRRMMNLFVGWFGRRVLPPFASTPLGEHGWRPPAVRPSPPPIGWSTGFWAVPRTVGRLPRWRLRPAAPAVT